MYRLGELILDICLLASVVMIVSGIMGYVLGVYSGLEAGIMVFVSFAYLTGAEGVAEKL